MWIGRTTYGPVTWGSGNYTVTSSTGFTHTCKDGLVWLN